PRDGRTRPSPDQQPTVDPRSAPMKRTQCAAALLVPLAFVAAACGSDNNSSSSATSATAAATTASVAPTTAAAATTTAAAQGGASTAAVKCPDGKLRFGVEPYEDPAKLTPAYQVVASALKEKLGCPVEVSVVQDYAAEVLAIENNKLELAEFGPL